MALDARRLAAGDADCTSAATAQITAELRAGRHVLACTAPDATAPESRALPALAPACGDLLRRVLQDAPVARVGVAGGDTSSHALRATAIWSFAWAGRLGAGVALLRAGSDLPALDGLEVMLKGGQMGDEDPFERLVAGTR